MTIMSTFVKMPLFSCLIITTNSFADNSNSPDLLDDVSKNQVKSLSQVEAADTHGERI